MQFKKQEHVALTKIKATPYNPPRRTTREAVSSLMASMDDVGLIYPVLVSSDYTVIEGNRRLAAAKFLKWKTIDIFKLDVAGADADRIYASINLVGKRMSGNDLICVWLQNQNAVSANMKGRIQRASDEVTLDLVKKLAKLGYSLRPVTLAREVCRYTDMGPGCYKQVVEYILDNDGVMGRLRQAMTEEVAPATIRRAIEGGKALKLVIG